jgi:hypothetical protein
MNTQIFGKSKRIDLKRTERYSKEKRIKCQLLDLGKHGMSLGEYKSVNKLLTPIVRNTRHACATEFEPDFWEEWV